MRSYAERLFVRPLLRHLLALLFAGVSLVFSAALFADDPPHNTTVVNYSLFAKAGAISSTSSSTDGGPPSAQEDSGIIEVVGGYVQASALSDFFAGRGPPLTSPVAVSSSIQFNGVNAQATASLGYTIGLDVIDALWYSLPGATPPPVNMAAILVINNDIMGDTTDAGVVIAGAVDSFASLKVSNWQGPLLYRSMSVCGVTVGSCIADNVNSVGDYFVDDIGVVLDGLLAWESLYVEMYASANFYGNLGSKAGGQSTARARGSATAVADPIFQIDPTFFYEIDGLLRPATDFFQLSVSEGINYIGPGPTDGPPSGSVPEPTTLALIGLSLAGLGIRRKKQA